MKEDDGSPPLDAPGGDAPPELVRALRALANERPSRAHLEHVAGKLEAILENAPASPAPSAVSAGVARSAGIKALALSFVIGAVALGGAAIWLRGSERADSHASRHVTAPEAAPVRLATPAEEAVEPAYRDSAANVATPETRARVPLSLQGEARHAARLAGRPSARVRRDKSEKPSHEGKRPSSAPSAKRSQPPPHVPAARAAETRGLAPAPDAAQATATVSRPEEARTRPVAAPLPPQPAPMRGEVQLLLEARRSLTLKPQDALKVLGEHSERFPKGLLAPEREVLAIEALRLLGQMAAAEQRLRAFQAQYPKSMHLLRLGRSSR